MATGQDIDPRAPHGADPEGHGQSAGIPARGQLEGNAVTPIGEVARQHWQASVISRPGLEDRGNVFFAAIEMTRMPMAVTDPNQPDNPIVFVNRAFLDMTGYAEDDVLGRNCRLLQGPDTDPATVAEVRTAVAERRAVAVDILNYKADRTPFWNALFAGPVFGDDGRLLYWFSSQMDITQRRMSEQSFRQAQKMEAIGQLTAGLAHDFNNLLQVIAGNLELARLQARGQQPLLDAIERASRAAHKGGQLTQQLLTFARKQRLEPKLVNLNGLVVEFSEMLVRTLGDKVDLRLDLRPGLPACTLDPTHLEMALLNVLINARDAMPEGGKVTVATSLIQDAERTQAHQLTAGRWVVLCVIDEGTGMAPEVLRRATEPFFTTKGPGTGLGLAMVHGFVQQSHGKLEIDSAPGRGTTVRMLFPAAGERAAAPAAPAEAPVPEGGSQTLLVVEDSDDVRHVAESFLRSLGYRVLSAASGEEALQVVEREGAAVDLLFTDIVMPGGMNGLQLAERARALREGLPVLLTTGYTEDAPPGRDARGAPTLLKPYRNSELAERVRSMLARTGSG